MHRESVEKKLKILRNSDNIQEKQNTALDHRPIFNVVCFIWRAAAIERFTVRHLEIDCLFNPSPNAILKPTGSWEFLIVFTFLLFLWVKLFNFF